MFSVYIQDDKIPINKFKTKYVTLFFDSIREMLTELSDHTYTSEDKLIIDPEKSTLITTNGFCFIRVYDAEQARIERKEITDYILKEQNHKKADMVFTDPPYGMNLDTDWSDAKCKSSFVEEK